MLFVVFLSISTGYWKSLKGVKSNWKILENRWSKRYYIIFHQILLFINRTEELLWKKQAESEWTIVFDGSATFVLEGWSLPFSMTSRVELKVSFSCHDSRIWRLRLAFMIYLQGISYSNSSYNSVCHPNRVHSSNIVWPTSLNVIQCTLTRSD